MRPTILRVYRCWSQDSGAFSWSGSRTQSRPGLWLGTVAVLLVLDLIAPTGATGIRVAAGAHVAAATYALSWAICKSLGRLPPAAETWLG